MRDIVIVEGAEEVEKFLSGIPDYDGDMAKIISHPTRNQMKLILGKSGLNRNGDVEAALYLGDLNKAGVPVKLHYLRSKGFVFHPLERNSSQLKVALRYRENVGVKYPSVCYRFFGSEAAEKTDRYHLENPSFSDLLAFISNEDWRNDGRTAPYVDCVEVIIPQDGFEHRKVYDFSSRKITMSVRNISI